MNVVIYAGLQYIRINYELIIFLTISLFFFIVATEWFSKSASRATATTRRAIFFHAQLTFRHSDFASLKSFFCTPSNFNSNHCGYSRAIYSFYYSPDSSTTIISITSNSDVSAASNPAASTAFAGAATCTARCPKACTGTFF